MELTGKNFSDFIERLKYHNLGEGVGDHGTANPLFIVQSLKWINGIDLDFDPKHYWTDCDSNEQELTDEELVVEIKRLESEEGYVFDGYHLGWDDNISVAESEEHVFEKIGYTENWEYVCAHFTKEGAEAFIKRKKHDHRELRIFVDSQYWCWEFNTIIEGLLSGKIIFALDYNKQISS